MPYRNIVFSANEIYHVVNRGVAGGPIFLSPKENKRFLEMIDFYRYNNQSLSFSRYLQFSLEDKEKLKKRVRKKLVEIFAFCLMPNHFHLLLKQVGEGTMVKTLANLENGYARYFNLKHRRAGPLFQSRFKAVRIETDEQLLHISRYIHLNPTSSYLVKKEDLFSYPWSSLNEYFDKQPVFTSSEFVLQISGGKRRYREFILDQAEYQRELDKLKHLSLENP